MSDNLATVRIGRSYAQGPLQKEWTKPKRRPPLYKLEMVTMCIIQIGDTLICGERIMQKEEASNAQTPLDR